MSNSQINLPKTAFSMKANLPVREPEILEYWKKINLYQELRQSSKGKEKFVLHDGPPYANGNIHMGTALNKILKDIIVKFHQMDGKDSIYVPGWDCHGLPIEWKIEEQYKKNKKNKNEVPVVEFRKECRSFAEKWIEVHKGQFKRLGVIGDWENYYSTMSYDAEAQIVRELGKFLKEGSLYRGFKPVLWSTVEKTALADAEVEYQDHKSDTIYTSFPVKSSNIKELDGSEVIIWTTTPWTIPANRALAYNEALDYVLLQLNDDGDFKNRKIVVAKSLLDSVIKECSIKDYKEIKKLKFKCIEVSEFTNSPEILEGRVKTLHPKIHAGILNKRNNKLPVSTKLLNAVEAWKKLNGGEIVPLVDIKDIYSYMSSQIGIERGHKTLKMADKEQYELEELVMHHGLLMGGRPWDVAFDKVGNRDKEYLRAIAKEAIIAIGFAIFWPAISGALPWQGSYIPCEVLFKDADGSMPIEPDKVAAISESISPKRLLETMTSY